VSVRADLYGSLSLTGKGHATDFAVILGLSGKDPEYIPVEEIPEVVNRVREKKEIVFGNTYAVDFDVNRDIVFNREFLPFHANGIRFTAVSAEGETYSETYYSIGGGLVVREEKVSARENLKAFNRFPDQVENAAQHQEYCQRENKTIWK